MTINEIDTLADEIKELRVSTEKEITKLRSATDNHLEYLVARIEELKKGKATPVLTESRHYTGHRDKFKNKIYIGDRVKFRTSGKFRTTEGEVSGYTRSRVTSIDCEGNEIPRAPHNLEIL